MRPTVGLGTHPIWCEPFRGPVVVVERPDAVCNATLRAYLHLLHLLTPPASYRVDAYDSTLSKELSQPNGRRSRPHRHLQQEMPVPDGAFPPVPPHRGAGHHNCDRRHLGRIEADDTTNESKGDDSTRVHCPNGSASWSAWAHGDGCAFWPYCSHPFGEKLCSCGGMSVPTAPRSS